MDDQTSPNVVQFEQFNLDRRTGRLLRKTSNGEFEPVNIGSRAIAVLCTLVEHGGDLVSKDEIMAAVWPDTVVEESNLTVQISALRKVLDQGGREQSFIQTLPGRGYRFVGSIAPSPDNARTLAPPESVAPPPGVGTAMVGKRRYAIWRPATAILVFVALVAAGWEAMRPGAYRWLLGKAAPTQLSIVVLPFANLGSDPEQDYFVEAITDDLTTDLSRISGSIVIAHSTAQSYRDRTMDVRRIGRELDVRFALEGSVHRMGDRVEVNAQLIDAESGTHVWADRFETDRRNLAEAQGEITDRLAYTLNLQLVEAVGRRIEREKATNPGASDLIMRGWVLWFRPFSPSNRQEALTAFERALEIEPTSSDARIGTATILISNIGLGSSQFPKQDGARAERLLLEAIERDAGSSRAHEALGTLRRIENRLDDARIEYETAVALDRNNPHALLGLGQTLMFLGRPGDGLRAIGNSLRVDPRDPNIAFGHWSLGTCHLLLGHQDQAIDLLRKARAENPRVYFFHLYLSAALGLRGDIEEARAALAEAIRLKPEVSSLARWSAVQPWISNPALLPLREKMLDAGLRRAGMPDT